MEKSSTCDNCNIDFHRASDAKRLRIKKHLENEKQKELTLTEKFSKLKKKRYNTKPSRQLEQENLKVNDSELNEELSKKMLNPSYFIDGGLKFGFIINLDCHHINHTNSKLIIKPNCPELGLEFRYFKEILSKMATIYARFLNEYIFKSQILFSARFDKQDVDGKVLDEIELFINLKNDQKLTESDIINMNVRFQIEEQIHRQEPKDSGWRFEKNKSMTLYFYKTSYMNGTSYVKTPLRSSAILNVQNDNRYCFIWSILAHFLPITESKNGHPTRVSTYGQFFFEIIIQSFDFSVGFICSDVHKFEKLKIYSINIVELGFYPDQNKWKQKQLTIEVSKNSSDRVVDLLIYKDHYVLIKKLNVSLGNHKCKYLLSRSLSS